MTHLALFAVMLAQQYANCTASVTTTPAGTVITTTCPTSVIVPPMVITSPVSLPGGTVGQFYSQDLSKLFNPTGGKAPYTYSATTLPPGLALSSSGMLTGTRTSQAAMNFSVTITDSEASH